MTKSRTISLQKRLHPLSESEGQLLKLEKPRDGFQSFKEKIGHELRPLKLETIQINLGKMCNQTCKHCHVDAGPDRKEIMTKKTMEEILTVLKNSQILKVDLTGGAPELNPEFRWFVENLKALGKEVMVRCNLTIINSNPRFYDLPNFFAQNSIEVISSLPHFSKIRTDSQRGEGVFERSINALQRLNQVGYGLGEKNLILNLVYNPTGAFLPAGQKSLEKEFKEILKNRHGVYFDQLYAITNMPISRFLEYLLSSGNYEDYMDTLLNAYNPDTISKLMCRNTISVGWDGLLYDCDFNQMLDLSIDLGGNQHIRDFKDTQLGERTIKIGNHCFGCTAGAGSSCGGTIS